MISEVEDMKVTTTIEMNSVSHNFSALIPNHPSDWYLGK